MCRDALLPSVRSMPVLLGRNLRRTTLLLHILCGVGWMGLDLGLMVLVVSGATTEDGAVAYTTAHLVIPAAVPALALGMLLTGIVLGLGTRYGLLQWTWVFTKLSIGVVLTVLVFVALLPGVLAIPDGLTGSADQVRAMVGGSVEDLIPPPFVSFTLLAVSLVLSIWKPWGRTPWSRRAREAASSYVAQDV